MICNHQNKTGKCTLKPVSTRLDTTQQLTTNTITLQQLEP